MIFREMRWWADEQCNDRRRASISSSLERDEIAQIDWLTGGENFVSKRDQLCLLTRYVIL